VRQLGFHLFQPIGGKRRSMVCFWPEALLWSTCSRYRRDIPSPHRRLHYGELCSKIKSIRDNLSW